LVPVRLQLDTRSPATYGAGAAATRSPRWDDVNSLQVLIYDGIALHHAQYFDNLVGPVDHLDLAVPEGTNLVAYAIANVPADTFTSGNAATLAALEGAVSAITRWDDIDTTWPAIVMTGHSTPVTVTPSGSAPVVKLPLRRIVAQLDITIATIPGTTVSKVALRNLPACSYYLAREIAGERDGKETDADTGRTAGKDAAAALDQWIASAPLGTTATTYRVYMYENRAGVTANADPTLKGAKAGDTRCTSLHIEGDNATHYLTWDIYLGGNATSNYNIKRNSIYAVTVTLQDGGTADVRITRTDK
jgi:hypothetical protein